MYWTLTLTIFLFHRTWTFYNLLKLHQGSLHSWIGGNLVITVWTDFLHSSCYPVTTTCWPIWSLLFSRVWTSLHLLFILSTNLDVMKVVFLSCWMHASEGPYGQLQSTFAVDIFHCPWVWLSLEDSERSGTVRAAIMIFLTVCHILQNSHYLI